MQKEVSAINNQSHKQIHVVQWCTYVHGQREAYFLLIIDLTLCYSNQNTHRSLKNVMDQSGIQGVNRQQ